MVILLILVCGIAWGTPTAIDAINRAQAEKREEAFTAELSAAINPILAKNTSFKIGIGITDARTNTVRAYGQTTAFPAASTAKILTALAYYHQVEQGELTLSQTIGAFPADFQLKQMINQSNNESWHLLVGTLGESYLQSYAASIGSDYTVGGNTLTAGSLSHTLIKLKQGSLLSPNHTKTLLSYMQATNDEELIPPALPQGVTVYHKYGLLDGALHDASILTDGSKTFSLVIYTQNATDQDDNARTDTIHELTRAIAPILFTNR